MRIEPNGHQIMTYGGDGIFTLADPKNSDVVYEETPQAGINVSTDGGVTWRSIDPFARQRLVLRAACDGPKHPEHLVDRRSRDR